MQKFPDAPTTKPATLIPMRPMTTGHVKMRTQWETAEAIVKTTTTTTMSVMTWTLVLEIWMRVVFAMAQVPFMTAAALTFQQEIVIATEIRLT